MTTTLNRWNPIRQLEDLQQHLLTAFRPVGMVYPTNGGAPDAQNGPSWAPSMDVIENEKGYLISADLPGVKKEDVSVMLEHDVVTVRGERKPAYAEPAENFTWHLNERPYGRFERTITLPKDVDTSSLEAKITDGVLFLSLSKKQEARPRLIEVN